MISQTASRKIYKNAFFDPTADTQDFLLTVFVIGALISNLIAALN